MVVLETAASTQDAPETLYAEVGTVVTTLRQMHGRGRLGRSWSDPNGEGVALTVVLPSQPFADCNLSIELLAIASALAAARAVEGMLREPVGIKWPNDLILRSRKLGGILIERSRDRILLGIGINVLQRDFPPALASIATSMSQAVGTLAPAARLELVGAVVEELECVLAMDGDSMLGEFRARDVLTGSSGAFATPTGTIEGIVGSVEPLRGLTVRTALGQHFLPAATTTVLSWKSKASL